MARSFKIAPYRSAQPVRVKNAAAAASVAVVVTAAVAAVVQAAAVTVAAVAMAAAVTAAVAVLATKHKFYRIWFAGFENKRASFMKPFFMS